MTIELLVTVSIALVGGVGALVAFFWQKKKHNLETEKLQLEIKELQKEKPRIYQPSFKETMKYSVEERDQREWQSELQQESRKEAEPPRTSPVLIWLYVCLVLLYILLWVLKLIGEAVPAL